MTDHDAFRKRGQALENEYFQRVDEALLKNLREASEREEQVEALTKAAGLHDQELASELLEMGIDAGNFAAFALTPLVFVAWADGNVSNSERQAVISSALRRGVNSDPLAFKLLEQWMQVRPSRELWTLWQKYARDLHQSLPPTTADKLSRRLIAQAEEVAKASGGVLGIGKVCAAEQRLLDEIALVLPERSLS
ncbi:hypothetical protein FYK55_11175 [Roseiconus nitratireducens]|uniref:Uncharacterized protein n=1 Tax=Roseiconus nitratireducens TaxID=2605748 RepID=A0A5M6D885_9BACT|nr:hypothetical protein [Roseiconus nitratireducens]KAA5543741.1 hypothetical protein FYK55_11175 [Roseiconus nitratireducens]